MRTKRLKYFSLFFLFLLVLIFGFIFKKRNSAYSFNTKSNYTYHFNDSDAQILDLTIRNGFLQLPQSIETGSSVFIEINGSASLMGNIFLPRVEMNNQIDTTTQFFEIGSAGVRYVNISSLLNQEGNEIQLRFKYYNLRKEDVKLYYFKKRDLSSEKILIVAPHPDDAEIAAYGLYSSHKNSFIATITAGDASGVGSGYFKYDELFEGDLHAHNIKKGQIRAWNSIAVPLLGNVKNDQVLNLGNFDGTLEGMYLNPEIEIIPEHMNEINKDIFRNYNNASLDSLLTNGNSWVSLLENLKLVLRKIQPDIIVVPYPLIDTHKDHQYTTLAMFEAIRALNIHRADLFLYTNHFQNELYPFGDMGSVVSLPPSLNLEIYFKSLYSFPLNFEQQRDKVLALDAMNDLRMDTEWIKWESLFLESMKTLNRQIFAKEKSYFRRAVRSNELFFVIPVEDIYNSDKMESIFGK